VVTAKKKGRLQKMDRVSSNIIVNDFNKEKERQRKMKHTEIVMEEWQRTLNQIDDDELDKLLLKRAKYRIEKYPIVTINEGCFGKELKYRCTVCKDNIYLESQQEEQDDWVQVEDLSELKIWEYNRLVNELHKHYPDYPIEYLEGRFV
jgi:hypothetical protein